MKYSEDIIQRDAFHDGGGDSKKINADEYLEGKLKSGDAITNEKLYFSVCKHMEEYAKLKIKEVLDSVNEVEMRIVLNERSKYFKSEINAKHFRHGFRTCYNWMQDKINKI